MTTMKMKRAMGTQQGFTILELIIVVTMIGILAAIALPNLAQMPIRSKEAVLKTNLRTIRQALDQYNGDVGYYPESLEILVDDEYLRSVPIDPITEETEWELIYETEEEITDLPETDLEAGGGGPGIIDVFSLSEDLALDGSAYNEW